MSASTIVIRLKLSKSVVVPLRTTSKPYVVSKLETHDFHYLLIQEDGSYSCGLCNGSCYEMVKQDPSRFDYSRPYDWEYYVEKEE